MIVPIYAKLSTGRKTLLLTILSFITSKLLFSCSGLKQFNPISRAIKSAHCEPVELLCLLAIIISTLVFMPLKLPLEHILLNSSSKSLSSALPHCSTTICVIFCCWLDANPQWLSVDRKSAILKGNYIICIVSKKGLSYWRPLHK
jgi:hypothetical protein